MSNRLFIYLLKVVDSCKICRPRKSKFNRPMLNLITCSVYNPVLTRMGFIFYRVQSERGLSHDYPRHL